MRFAVVVFLGLLLLPAVAVAGVLEDGQFALTHRDYKTALKLLQPLADSGNALAQDYVGAMYAGGLGVPQNLPEGIKWYRKAADQGLAHAQTALGLYYYDTRDFAKAMQWYRKAGAQGDSWALTWVGLFYLQGEGVSKDATEAARWFRKGAELGHYGGQYHLGELYADGHGVKKDESEAYFWLSLAANSRKNNARAAIRDRDRLASHLTREQITAEQKRVSEWKPTPALAKAETK